MKIGSAIAIYFIIWWTVLFAILPLRVQNNHEAGKTLPDGHDAGAPMQPHLVYKALMTTLVSAVIFAIAYWAIASGILGG